MSSEGTIFEELVSTELLIIELKLSSDGKVDVDILLEVLL